MSALLSPSSTRTLPTSSENCRRISKRFAGDIRARHWNHLFDSLRHTVDQIYETCRYDRSIIECKEAHLILTRCAKDFESLITALNVEDSWAEEKPTAVAWEIRKSVGSPTKYAKHPPPSVGLIVETLELAAEQGKAKDSDARIETTCNEQPTNVSASGSYADKVKSPKAAIEEAEVTQTEADAQNTEKAEGEEEGWNIVSNKARRRRVKSQSSSSGGSHSVSSHWREMTGGNFMNPRTAMDIPQTKASMAKMAYSRRLMWEKKHRELQEKLFAQQRANQAPRKAGSYPSLNRIGINFADPKAVKRTAQAYKAKIDKRRNKGKFRSFQSVESLHSLGSIKEEEVGAKEQAPIADEHSSLQKDSNQPTEESDRRQDHEWKEVQSLPANWWERRSSVTTKEEDDAWQHLTEEEESLAQEEESLQKEIEEEEGKSIDAEMEKHAAATEEPPVELDEGPILEIQKLPVDRPMAWQDIVARWQVESHMLAAVSWGELVETELSGVRQPGQAAQMHEKLSSPSRKRNMEDVGKRHEEKLAKAEELRQKLMKEQGQKLNELFKKVEEVRAKKREVMEQKKLLMDTRMARATENREHQIQAIVRKAKDEEDKVMEIAFIKNLEADGRRHDVMVRHQDHEQRLLSIQEERQRKVDEKVAREHAAEERRKAQAEERACRLRDLADKKRRRQEQIEQQKTEQEKERLVLAKEKAREREDRLAERKAAQEANAEELKHRILIKQEKTCRRHEENLEQIKIRASEMSVQRAGEAGVSESVLSEWNGPPSSVPYPCLKLCSLCRVLIPSDLHLVAHLRSPKHSSFLKEKSQQQGFLLSSVIIEAPPSDNNNDSGIESSECDKAAKTGNNKKRRQKLRQKMQIKLREYQNQMADKKGGTEETPSWNKMRKILTDWKAKVAGNGKDKVWLPTDVHFLERSMGEMSRMMSSEGKREQQMAFWELGGVDLVLGLLGSSEKSISELPVPLRSITNAANLLKTSISGNWELCVELLYGNRLPVVADAAAYQMKVIVNSFKKDSSSNLIAGFIISALQLVSVCLSEILRVGKSRSSWKQLPGGQAGFRCRAAMMGSYVVVSGLMDNAVAFIDGWSDIGKSEETLLFEIINFFTTFLASFISSGSEHDPFSKCSVSLDSGGLLVGSIQKSHLCGLLSCLYTELLNPNVSHDRLTPPELSEFCVKLSRSVLRMLNVLAALSHSTVQNILCCEYTSLEFRHIVSFLINYASRHQKDELLHVAIVAVGHFVCQSADNQILVQSGTQPSILHQLCVLPFCYFSDPKLIRILFPTLIASTYKHESNKQILEEELSGTLLAGYLENESSAGSCKTSQSDDFCDLHWRFPSALWSEARSYFDSSNPI